MFVSDLNEIIKFFTFPLKSHKMINVSVFRNTRKGCEFVVKIINFILDIKIQIIDIIIHDKYISV